MILPQIYELAYRARKGEGGVKEKYTQIDGTI